MKRLLFRRGLSLRVRLALLSSALLGVTLILFSLTVYFIQARTLVDEVDRSLVDRAEVIASAITVSGVQPDQTVGLQLPDADALAVTGTLVQFVNLTSGTIEARSDLLARYGLALPITQETVDAVRSGAARLERLTVSGVRSSCDASATKRRCESSAAARRSLPDCSAA